MYMYIGYVSNAFVSRNAVVAAGHKTEQTRVIKHKTKCLIFAATVATAMAAAVVAIVEVAAVAATALIAPAATVSVPTSGT